MSSCKHTSFTRSSLWLPLIALFDRLCSGSGIFKSENPEKLARAVVLATTHYQDPVKLAEISCGLGEGMKGESRLGAEAGKVMTADRGY